MAGNTKYSMWCESYCGYLEVWSNEVPTQCPNDPTHLIYQDRTVAIGKPEQPTDRSEKLRVHATARQLGTVMYWTSRGDDSSNPSDVGHGDYFKHDHLVGVSGTLYEEKYIDFNAVENETWLNEGYLMWKDCNMDTVSVELTTITCEGEVSSGTNYNLYYHLVVPAYPGTGTFAITSDLTSPTGGLVMCPPNDLGVSSICYFDADWNSTTKKFENIQPNYSGKGNYNIFAAEVPFARFFNEILLMGDGSIRFASNDVDQLGHGMRFKLIYNTNTSEGDHHWHTSGIITLNRANTC